MVRCGAFACRTSYRSTCWCALEGRLACASMWALWSVRFVSWSRACRACGLPRRWAGYTAVRVLFALLAACWRWWIWGFMLRRCALLAGGRPCFPVIPDLLLDCLLSTVLPIVFVPGICRCTGCFVSGRWAAGRRRRQRSTGYLLRFRSRFALLRLGLIYV